jgi:pyruvate dehydrogenase E1 component beta subunit
LSVLVPSTPADAGRLMLTALELGSPAVFMEHKLISTAWREFLGSGGRDTVSYDVPRQGEWGDVPDRWEPLPIGKAELRRPGSDLTIVTLGVSTHRALQASEQLRAQGISAGVLDLRSVSPLDHDGICEQVARTRRMLVVDEDYEAFGLSAEVAAVALEAGLQFKYARVCTQDTIPFARDREDEALPNVRRIVDAACRLM